MNEKLMFCKSKGPSSTSDKIGTGTFSSGTHYPFAVEEGVKGTICSMSYNVTYATLRWG